MPYKNKEDQKAAARKHYLANKDKVKKRAKEWTKAYYKNLKILINRYKTIKGCRICGYRKCAEALEFHHPDPAEKEFSVATAFTIHYSKERIKEEVLKCVILCANCHRELHVKIKNAPIV